MNPTQRGSTVVSNSFGVKFRAGSLSLIISQYISEICDAWTLNLSSKPTQLVALARSCNVKQDAVIRVPYTNVSIRIWYAQPVYQIWDARPLSCFLDLKSVIGCWPEIKFRLMVVKDISLDCTNSFFKFLCSFRPCFSASNFTPWDKSRASPSRLWSSRMSFSFGWLKERIYMCIIQDSAGLWQEMHWGDHKTYQNSDLLSLNELFNEWMRFYLQAGRLIKPQYPHCLHHEIDIS